MKTIRDIIHIIGGFSLMYLFGNISGLFSSDYDGIPNRICVAIVLGIFATSLGIFYGFVMNRLDNERKADFKDALRTGLGGGVIRNCDNFYI